MDGIKIKVVGSTVMLLERPEKLVAGTKGLPVEFQFDSQWDGFREKYAIYQVSAKSTPVTVTIGTQNTLPTDALIEGSWLKVGILGVSSTQEFTTEPVDLGLVRASLTPGDVSPGDTTSSILQQITKKIDEWATKPAAQVAYVDLLSNKWEQTDDANKYSQVITVSGATPTAFSQVDLKPSADMLEEFSEKELALTTENDGGIITAFAVGSKPEKDYHIQVSLTEVVI